MENATKTENPFVKKLTRLNVEFNRKNDIFPVTNVWSTAFQSYHVLTQ